jgi:hypothetical protein
VYVKNEEIFYYYIEVGDGVHFDIKHWRNHNHVIFINGSDPSFLVTHISKKKACDLLSRKKERVLTSNLVVTYLLPSFSNQIRCACFLNEEGPLGRVLDFMGASHAARKRKLPQINRFFRDVARLRSG